MRKEEECGEGEEEEEEEEEKTREKGGERRNKRPFCDELGCRHHMWSP